MTARIGKTRPYGRFPQLVHLYYNFPRSWISLSVSSPRSQFLSLSLSLSFLEETRSMLQSLCSPRVSQRSIASQCHKANTHTHTQNPTHLRTHTHTQLKFISPSYEMQLLFLSPSLSLSGGIHMDKRRGKWVFRAAITSSQGGNNNNHVLYEALRTAGPTGWLTRLASGIGGGALICETRWGNEPVCGSTATAADKSPKSPVSSALSAAQKTNKREKKAAEFCTMLSV